MSGLTTELAPQILAACQTGAAEAASALGRCFGGEIQLQPQEPQALHAEELAADWHGPGVILALLVGDEGAVVVLPRSSGLVPDWCEKPDATGVSKLATLAQELGMTLLPEDQMPLDFVAQYVPDIAAALVRGGLTDACDVTIEITRDVAPRGKMHLLWPLPYPKQIFAPAEAEKPAAATGPAPTSAAAAQPMANPRPALPRDLEDAIPTLPPYIRSLLRIKVDVMVTLADTKLPVQRVIELGMGTILQFDKSCEAPLTLQVGNTDVAVGEAVKIGDKFGLRITSMVLPEERFSALGNRSPRKAG
jgi:flagellar motor switch/type III secretory pathway protein FliN